MSKHTAGPWVRQHGLNLVGKNRRLVANCGGHAQNFDVAENDAENEANANIVAAALDMLASLEELTEFALCIDWFADPPAACGKCKLCRAKAAIARAKGE